MKNDLEFRSFNFDVQANETDEGSILYGKPIVFDSRTDLFYFDEIIEKGALDNTDLTDVRFLVNHDTSRIPLARSRRNNGNSTMRLIKTDSGLEIEVRLDVENNSEARSLYSAVKRGDISGMSFMFSIDDEKWEDENTDHPLRRVKSIKSVVEVSAVSFPAYESTSINARNKNKVLESARSLLENVRSQSNKSLENDNSEIEIAKAKLDFILKMEV
ncbi:MAG: HK97 family phage prohead protease [Lachnobacterium sp.]|nr:HK97 family phage prohead protease [Lachnobacterium sp.]